MEAYNWAIVGVCVAIGVCVIALIVFVIIFCRLRIKDDSNIRKRIITRKAYTDERPQYIPPEEPEPEPIPVPIVLPPPPPPVIIERPRFIPQPALPPPPPEPKVIIREIHHHDKDPSPQPVKRVVRRSSWSGANDEWVLVKKIKKQRERQQSRRARDDSSSDSDSSSSSDDETTTKKPQKTAIVPVRYAVPRLDPYDLAVPRRPAVYGVAAAAPAMVPVQAAAFTSPMLQPVAGIASNQPGYVSVLMPQSM